MESFFSGNGGGLNFAAMLKTNDISPAIQRHLSRVYLSLCGTLLSCALGAYVDLLFHIGSTGFLSMLISMGLLMFLSSIDPKQTQKKTLVLMAFGFCQGLSLGGLIELAIHVNPAILITAFLGTTAIFGCFSASALLATRRQYLYLGALLSSVMSCMFVVSLMNIFFQSTVIWTVHLYLGLFVFCGYVLFDTQMIIEKANLGDRDYIQHSVELFMDFVAIFVRIVIILLRNADKKKKRNRNND